MSSGEAQMNEADTQMNFPQECESGVLLLRPSDSCIKRWLLLLRKAASKKDSHGPESHAVHRQRLLLAIIILFSLTVMVLLLLWNYQCIFIDRLCKGNEESSVFPVFGEWMSTSSPTAGRQV